MIIHEIKNLITAYESTRSPMNREALQIALRHAPDPDIREMIRKALDEPPAWVGRREGGIS